MVTKGSVLAGRLSPCSADSRWEIGEFEYSINQGNGFYEPYLHVREVGTPGWLKVRLQEVTDLMATGFLSENPQQAKLLEGYKRPIAEFMEYTGVSLYQAQLELQESDWNVKRTLIRYINKLKQAARMWA